MKALHVRCCFTEDLILKMFCIYNNEKDNIELKNIYLY